MWLTRKCYDNEDEKSSLVLFFFTLGSNLASLHPILALVTEEIMAKSLKNNRDCEYPIVRWSLKTKKHGVETLKDVIRSVRNSRASGVAPTDYHYLVGRSVVLMPSSMVTLTSSNASQTRTPSTADEVLIWLCQHLSWNEIYLPLMTFSMFEEELTRLEKNCNHELDSEALTTLRSQCQTRNRILTKQADLKQSWRDRSRIDKWKKLVK